MKIFKINLFILIISIYFLNCVAVIASENFEYDWYDDFVEVNFNSVLPNSDDYIYKESNDGIIITFQKYVIVVKY